MKQKNRKKTDRKSFEEPEKKKQNKRRLRSGIKVGQITVMSF